MAVSVPPYAQVGWVVERVRTGARRCGRAASASLQPYRKYLGRCWTSSKALKERVPALNRNGTNIPVSSAGYRRTNAGLRSKLRKSDSSGGGQKTSRRAWYGATLVSET